MKQFATLFEIAEEEGTNKSRLNYYFQNDLLRHEIELGDTFGFDKKATKQRVNEILELRDKNISLDEIKSRLGTFEDYDIDEDSRYVTLSEIAQSYDINKSKLNYYMNEGFFEPDIKLSKTLGFNKDKVIKKVDKICDLKEGGYTLNQIKQKLDEDF